MGLFNWLKKILGPSNPSVPPLLPRQRVAPPQIPLQSPVSEQPVPPLSQRSHQTSPHAQSALLPIASKKLNLEASQFTPLADADVKKQASKIGRIWGNPWFGRRDLIPPVSDERTVLIDRAMVGHGFITPEQLSEIHEVGAQMDEIRPDLALAKEVADQSVAASEQERLARKQEKKAEAAARKKQHAEDVARRRATDIVFLGRGVSGGLSDRRANIEILQQAQLPALATPADLAGALKISISRLRWLAFHSEATPISHYIYFTIPKRSGGTRDLAAPHHDLSACQQWILTNILEKIPVRDPAHGFVPGRGTMSNAVMHVGRNVVINADLKNFFPSITFPRVKGVFQDMGYSPAVATILALLCTECPRRKVVYDGKPLFVAAGPRALPQGACTSPALSNLIARKLDARLSGLAHKINWTYTRYADDLTFSCDGEAAQKTAWLLARVRHIVGDENFSVNEKKTRILRKNTAQTVTGIVVNQRPNVPRATVKRIRAILHRAQKEGLEAQNRENHPNFLAWLSGMIAYISMVNPNKGKELREAFDKLIA